MLTNGILRKTLALGALLGLAACGGSFHTMPPLTSAETWQAALQQQQQLAQEPGQTRQAPAR